PLFPAGGRTDSCQGSGALPAYSAASHHTTDGSGRLMQDTVENRRAMGPLKAGLDWVYRSVFLFRQNPPKWLIHALLYAMLFVMLPSVPALPVLISLVIILFWPTFLALFMGVFREADANRDTEPRELVEEIKPNFVRLITLGGIFLAYGILTGVLVKGEVAALNTL